MITKEIASFSRAAHDGNLYCAKFPRSASGSLADLCISQGIFGYSWPKLYTGFKSIDDTREDAQKVWKDGRKGARPTLTCFKHIIDNGFGLIWLKDKGLYYLCVTEGVYRSSCEYGPEITHYLDAQYYEVPDSRVPWSVRRAPRNLMQPRYDEQLIGETWDIYRECAAHGCVMTF